MKIKHFLIILVGLAIFGCKKDTNSKNIKVKGSDTVLPLSQLEAEHFMNDNPLQTVTVTGGGSGVGISSLIAGTTEIAQSSRKIKFDEKFKLQVKNESVEELIIAYDALAIIVHPTNPINNLTREELEDIFTGKISNWKELGGEDLKIIPYSRETSSGTYEFFKEAVLNNKNFMNGIMSMPATGAVVQSTSQTKGAISYIGLGYLNNSIKAINVSYDKGSTFIEPTIANAKNKTYPIVRPLYFYYLSQHSNSVQPFIDYIFSSKGQNLVSELGLITIH